jgi:hypothetical protein
VFDERDIIRDDCSTDVTRCDRSGGVGNCGAGYCCGFSFGVSFYSFSSKALLAEQRKAHVKIESMFSYRLWGVNMGWAQQNLIVQAGRIALDIDEAGNLPESGWEVVHVNFNQIGQELGNNIGTMEDSCMGVERRASPRYPVMLAVRVRPVDGSDDFAAVATLLSRSSVEVRCEASLAPMRLKQIQPPCLCDLLFQLPSEQQPLMLSGRTLTYRRVSQQHFVLVFLFKELDEQQEHNLAQLLETAVPAHLR